MSDCCNNIIQENIINTIISDDSSSNNVVQSDEKRIVEKDVEIETIEIVDEKTLIEEGGIVQQNLPIINRIMSGTIPVGDYKVYLTRNSIEATPDVNVVTEENAEVLYL